MLKSIKHIINELDNKINEESMVYFPTENSDKPKNLCTGLFQYSIYGWVRTVRSSSNILGFCVINDGSNVNGMQMSNVKKKCCLNVKCKCVVNVKH